MIKSSPSTSFKTIKALVESSSSENNESDESEEITNKTISPFTTTTTTTSNDDDDDDDNDETKTCSEPSINDFPTDIFTQTQRRFGAILFHIAFVVYLCVALMRVCDDYFLPSLECISERLQLDQDVAGATFMAAGSSAPEVFISLVGVFVSKSDAGIGSIVGSAVFNILFVIGICGLFIVNVRKRESLLYLKKKTLILFCLL